MKKITVSILSVLMMLSMVFSSSVFAANEKVSAWDSFLGLFSGNATTTATDAVGVEYRGHIQNKGDFPLDGTWIQGPNVLGTTGEALRLEGFWIQLTNQPENVNIQYRVHVQNEGWMDPVENGDFAGTEGKSQQIEAIEINLVDDEGDAAVGYSVQYKGHIQNIGDTVWFEDGQQLGTVGSFLRLEALEVKIVQLPADLTAYEAALAAVTEADYTAASWTAYEAVVDANVVTEDNSQAEVNEATAAIEAAQANLVKVLKVESVSANNVKEIEVTFTTPVTGFNSTSAVFGTNYDILDPAGASLTVGGGTATIAKITDSKYKITTSKEMGIGEYTFKINKDVVTSTDNQKNPLQFVKFQGSAAKDTTPPTVSSATYNANSGEVVVNFSEPIKIESVVKTGFVVTDGTTQVALTANESAIANGTSTTVTFGLSTATKTSIASLGATKTLSVQAGAIKDKADNAIVAVSDISLSPVAQLASSTFDASTNLLTLTFTKTVDVSTLTITQLALQSSAGNFGLTADDKIQTTVDGTTVVIKIAEDAQTAQFKGTSVINRKVALTQDTFFKTTEAEPQVVLTSTANVTYTADTGKPVLVSATYNTNNTLVLQFNKPVKADTAAIGANIALTDWFTAPATSTPSDVLTIDGLMNTANSYSDTLTFSASAPGKAVSTSLSSTANRALTTTSKVYFPKDIFADAAGNKNVAVTSANGILVNYIDQVAPQVNGTATQISLTQTQITFDKPVTKATAEAIANYTVTAPGAANLTVQSVQLLSDEKTANITVTPGATVGVSYTVKVSNVTSKYGNVPVSTTANNSATWVPTTPSAGTGPDLTTVKFVDTNANYKIDEGDKLTLTYDQAITVSGVTKDDFALAIGTGSAVTTFGTGATFVAGVDSNQLSITLGSTPDISFGNTIQQLATPHIKSLTSVNAILGSALAIASPDATTPAITTSVYEDTNADGKVSTGDRLTLTFTKNMDRSIAANTILGTVSTAAGATLQTNDAAVVIGAGATAEWVDATTMRITLGTTPNLGTSALAYLQTATFKAGTTASVKDVWGNALDSAQSAIATTSDDKTRPTITSVTIAAATPTATIAVGDEIRFTMSESVNVNDVAEAGGLSVYVGPTAVASQATAASSWTVSGTTLIYTVQAGDVLIDAVNAQDISTVTVSATRAGKILDASGNTTITPAGFGLTATLVQK